MKLKNLYISLILLPILVSCKSEEPAPQREEVSLPVSFTIQLALENQNTRAGGNEGTTWEEDEEGKYEDGAITVDDGTTFDNTINSITPVLYFHNGGKLNTGYPVAQMTDQKWEKVNGESGVFRVTGTLKSSNWSTDLLTNDEYKDRYRIALFINCGENDVMTPLNINTPAQATFNHHGKPDDCRDDNSKHFHGIPMYGVAVVKFVVDDSAEEGKKYKVLGSDDKELNINILRSMAKVRVMLSEELKNKEEIKLTELYISRHAVKGYVVPKGWNTTTDVAFLSNGKAMNPFTGGTASDPGYYNHDCYVRPQTEENGFNGVDNKHENNDDYYANTENLLRFYIPDTFNYANDGDDGSKEIYLRLSYTVDGQPYTHLLWFRPTSDWPKETGYGEIDEDGKVISDADIAYPSGTPWDIIRNHIYEFVIEGVEATTGNLNVNVSVKNWVKHHFDLNEDDILKN